MIPSLILFNTLFQHTAARRRLHVRLMHQINNLMFQHTAARRRLLGYPASVHWHWIVSTHSRAEAAAQGLASGTLRGEVSTHSRAEAAAKVSNNASLQKEVSTHSRAEAAAFRIALYLQFDTMFQHTAARRRLRTTDLLDYCQNFSFNTQPRGGGCVLPIGRLCPTGRFQHTAARRRLRIARIS